MQTLCSFSLESQTQDDGSPVIAWFIVPVGDNNGEPIAGGFCLTPADARSDARIWLAAHPLFSVASL